MTDARNAPEVVATQGRVGGIDARDGPPRARGAPWGAAAAGRFGGIGARDGPPRARDAPWGAAAAGRFGGIGARDGPPRARDAPWGAAAAGRFGGIGARDGPPRARDAPWGAAAAGRFGGIGARDGPPRARDAPWGAAAAGRFGGIGARDGPPRARDAPWGAAAEGRFGGIDSHQHFWRLDRGDYGWLTPALGPIHRDFGPGDLAPLLARHGIGRTILVQAAPTPAETRWLLDVARSTPFVAGVVGWVDFEAADAAEAIAALAADPKLVGLRPMVQDIADDDWLVRPVLDAAFRAMIRHHLVFDALVLPRHLPRLVRVLDRHPELVVVVDHGAKPRLRDRDLDSWRRDLAAVAAHPSVACKLSGLVTEAPEGAGIDVIGPVADTLIGLFGPRRLLWGSDWPVVNLAGGYDRWRAISVEALARLPAEERDAVLGGNAERVYLRRLR